MALTQPQALFASLREGLLGPALSSSEVAGTEAILHAMEACPLAWVAYALGTAYHETAHTMQPVREIGGDGYLRRMYDPLGNRPEVARRLGNTQAGDGIKFAGRGYVQLTGRANYAKASRELGRGNDLIDHPDLAMGAEVAAQILRKGMCAGWFTGRSLATFLPHAGPATFQAFKDARKIINGSDRDADIAGYAMAFQTALQAGGWQ